MVVFIRRASKPASAFSFVLLCFMLLSLPSVSAHAGDGCNAFIYGMHDYFDVAREEIRNLLTHNGERRGWILVLQSLNNYYGGLNQEVVNAADDGFGVLVRLHWGYGGEGGQPVESLYSEFASHGANFIQNHINYCKVYQINNEPNLCDGWPDGGAGDGRCWPNCTSVREWTTVQRYATCFQMLYNAIDPNVRSQARLCLMPAAVWAGKFRCPNDEFDTDDFICYTQQCYDAIPHYMIGGLTFHPKTHHHDPSEITNPTPSNPVFGCNQNESVYWYFYVYKDLLDDIPSDLRDRPIFFTELNPHEYGWTNSNNGYVVQSYEEVNYWNSTHSDRKITAMMLYRWNDGDDRWDIHSRPKVQEDLHAAVTYGRTSNGLSICGGPPIPTPTPSGGLLSEGKPAYASSENSPEENAGEAVDGVIGAGDKWTSIEENPSWWYVDLLGAYSLEQVKVYAAGAGGEPAYFNLRGYTVRASNSSAGNPGDWTIISSYDTGDEDGENIVTHPVSGSYRYVGLHITNAGIDDYARVPEVQVYGGGAPAPTPTPVQTPTPDPSSSNLSLCSVCWAASSWYSKAEIGLKAFDDVVSAGSKWCSSGGSVESWLALDLGADHSVTHITVQHAGAGGEPQYYNTEAYRLESGTSLSGGWSTLAEVDNSSQQNTTTTVFGSPVSLRYVRLYITDAGIDNHARIPEFQVFGHDASGSPETFRIEGEDYHSYYDTDPQNRGEQYRDDGVDIEICQNDDGGYNVGWTAAGEWLQWNINVAPGTYRLFIRHAGESQTGYVHVELDGENVTGSISLPPTLSWQTWATKDAGTIDIGSGSHTLRLYEESGGFNINYLRFEPEGPPQPTNTPVPTNTPSGLLPIVENFETMPDWTYEHEAPWGEGPAQYSIQPGGQSGNYLHGTRSVPGSSPRVIVYNVPSYTDITVSIYMRCPSFGGTYWMESAFKLGNYTAEDFDGSVGTWTMIKKFSNDGTNGNGNVWTQYQKEVNTGSNTQISVGIKLGSWGGGGPAVGWDTLVIDESQQFGFETLPGRDFIGWGGRDEANPGLADGSDPSPRVEATDRRREALAKG